ncbi:hypothetical protein SELMODRAFT_424724 [Selaginella moellendorffii]|uniref:Uncharacterized protein n=1 Tax=Selaginella moellendorffii TaxID=88036 RepID=D8SQV1_SELML|nr:hypothetical protein SELMODRAFT_424724 [Selaginella moellendorffii]
MKCGSGDEQLGWQQAQAHGAGGGWQQAGRGASRGWQQSGHGTGGSEEQQQGAGGNEEQPEAEAQPQQAQTGSGDPKPDDPVSKFTFKDDNREYSCVYCRAEFGKTCPRRIRVRKHVMSTDCSEWLWCKQDLEHRKCENTAIIYHIKWFPIIKRHASRSMGPCRVMDEDGQLTEAGPRGARTTG